MPTTILTHGRVTWTEILQPTEEDIQQLSARYPSFHALNLQDCLTELEIPKLDHYDDYVFLVVQFPVWEAVEKIPQPAEVDIFVARGTLATSHRGQLKTLERLFAQAQTDGARRTELMEQGASPLLYRLLDALVDDCFPLVQQVERGLRKVEAELFSRDSRAVLNKIALLRRTVIALRHSLHPQLEIVRCLERGNWPFIHEELDIYWSDLSDHLGQICATLDQHAEVLAALSETVDILASHRIDEVVRLLTIVTVLTMPLTLLATIFGMNVFIPFQDHPAFFVILGLGLGLTVLLILVLNKRRWL
jgi:magnesium transporter